MPLSVPQPAVPYSCITASAAWRSFLPCRNTRIKICPQRFEMLCLEAISSVPALGPTWRPLNRLSQLLISI